MTTTSDTPRVLLVGAYERDNVGDLLFLLLTEKYLTGAEVVAGAPFGSDMTALLDRQVHAYGPLLESEDFDAIWTVGGQVGRMDLRGAYWFSASPEEYQVFKQSTRTEQATILRTAVSDAPIVSPYIPSPIAYPRNAGAITVLNSVGVEGIRGADTYHREELLSLLHGTTLTSVRDQASSDYLREQEIDHQLAPDAVHAISEVHPHQRDRDSDIAIVQASSGALNGLGYAKVAKAIADSPDLTKLRIRFLLAGAAVGHDSVESYQTLQRHVRRLVPNVDVDIITDRRPYDLVDHLARARVVVSTSLHARIIASAYQVPRVSLTRPKATKYAATWDPLMPYDVELSGLGTAVRTALSKADDPDVLAGSAELTRRAHENLTDLAEQVLTTARTQTEDDVAARIRTRRQQQAMLLATRSTVRDVELARVKSDLRRIRKELSEIKSSRSYLLAKRGITAGRVVRRSLRRARTVVRRDG